MGPRTELFRSALSRLLSAPYFFQSPFQHLIRIYHSCVPNRRYVHISTKLHATGPPICLLARSVTGSTVPSGDEQGRHFLLLKSMHHWLNTSLVGATPGDIPSLELVRL